MYKTNAQRKINTFYMSMDMIAASGVGYSDFQLDITQSGHIRLIK